MSTSSKTLIKRYRTLVYWYDGLLEAANCWRAGKVGIEFTDDERAKLYSASEHMEEAKKLVTEIYSKRIGEAVTLEVRIGGPR